MFTNRQEDWIGLAIGSRVGVAFVVLGALAGLALHGAGYALAPVVWIAASHVFRHRFHGRASLVNSWSFDTSFQIGLGVALSVAAGQLLVEWATIPHYGLYILVVLIVASIWICAQAFKEGPVYGWDEVFHPL